MDKIAAYEMLLAAHPLWEKDAGMERLGIQELPGKLKKVTEPVKKDVYTPLPEGRLQVGGDVQSVLKALGMDDDFFAEFKKKASLDKGPASSMGVYELPDHLRDHFKIIHKRPVLIEMSDRQIARIRSDGFSVPKRVSPEVEAAHWKARAAQAR